MQVCISQSYFITPNCEFTSHNSEEKGQNCEFISRSFDFICQNCDFMSFFPPQFYVHITQSWLYSTQEKNNCEINSHNYLFYFVFSGGNGLPFITVYAHCKLIYIQRYLGCIFLLFFLLCKVFFMALLSLMALHSTCLCWHSSNLAFI